MDSYGSARFLQQVIVNRVSQNGGKSWLADVTSASENDPAHAVIRMSYRKPDWTCNMGQRESYEILPKEVPLTSLYSERRAVSTGSDAHRTLWYMTHDPMIPSINHAF